MPTLAAPVQLISRVSPDPRNPIINPALLLEEGDVQISTGGSPFVNIATLPTASGENDTDLIIQLSNDERTDDYKIKFHDLDGVWVDVDISVTCPAPVELPEEEPPDVYPPASDVREGVDRGDGVLGTLYLPVDELSESKPQYIVSGDSYRESVGNAITYLCSTLRDMPSERSAFKFTIKNQTTGDLEVDHLDASSVDVEERLIRFELGSDHTSLDPDDSYRYDVEIPVSYTHLTLPTKA